MFCCYLAWVLVVVVVVVVVVVGGLLLLSLDLSVGTFVRFTWVVLVKILDLLISYVWS